MSWQCAGCGQQNPEGTRFCGHCGAPAASSSSSPAAPVPPGGTSPGPPTDPRRLSRVTRLDEEQRLVTAVFADLSGFTALADRLGPNELHEIIAPLISRLAGVAERYGGYVAKYAGDALLVFFGAPTGQEDHAERALLAALHMHSELDETVSRLAAEASGLRLHIGVNSGRVVAGLFGGEVSDYSILGDSVNVAQRLESVAPPGDTYVGELTYRLAEPRFDFAPLGHLVLKGKKLAVPAWRLLGQRTEHPEPDRHIRSGRHLIAREREIAATSEFAEALLGGQGGLLLVQGEPGIGKSRLIEELRRRATGVRWLDGNCLSYASSVPYWPYIDLLRRAFGFRSGEAGGEAAQRLGDTLVEAGLPDALPYLARLLGIPAADVGGASDDLTPEAFRSGLHRCLVAWMRALARNGPLLIAIEDVHWADASTVELTQEVARLGRNEPVGVLLSGRPEAQRVIQAVTEAAQGVRTQVVDLGPLDAPSTRRLVEHLLDGLAPQFLVATMTERTGGNPFFVEEMVRSLLDAGALHRNGTWRLEAGWDVASLPPTIEGVLSARIDLLPRAASGVLQTASVIGRVVRWPLLEAVADNGVDLEDAVERLVEGAFLERHGRDGEESLAFRHPLVLEVAYSRPLRRRRRELHRRVAESTEALYGSGDDVIDFLARHLYLADAGEKAVDYLCRAGERSKRLFANDEAVLHFNRALEVLGKLPETSKRHRRELQVQLALASPLIAIRGHGALEVERLCERARELGQQVGTVPELFPVLFGLVGFHVARGSFRRASEFGEQLKAVAEEAADEALVVVASFALGVTLFYRGRLEEARQHLQQGIDIYRPDEHAGLALQYPFDPGVGCLRVVALVLCLLGYPEEGLARATEALTLAREAGHPYGLAAATIFSAILHQLRGETRAVRDRAEATIALSAEHGFPLWLGWARILEGWALVHEAVESRADAERTLDLAVLVSELSESLSAYEESGSQIFRPYWMALAAEARRQAAEVEEALSLVTCGLQVAEENDERWWEAELWRLRGEFMRKLAAGREAEAEGSFRQALEVAARQGARMLELRAAISLSRLWHTLGRVDEARELLARVYHSTVPGAATRDAETARSLLEELQRSA